MDLAKSYYDVVARLPKTIGNALLAVPQEIAEVATEVRLRSNRLVTLTTPKGAYILTSPTEKIGVICTYEELTACFHALCNYSVHSVQHCIRNGFVPVSGGHRAGVCGTAYTDAEGFLQIKNITSINLRIARSVETRCPTLLQSLAQEGGGVLFAGVPSSGKTTVLRSFSKTLSELGCNVSVVDERGEIAPVERDNFLFDVPLHCDVLSGYPKHIGVQHALRSLAPDVILCDEIGAMEDARAIESAANAGVRIGATIHGATLESLMRRPQAQAMLQTGAFQKIAFLTGPENPGVIREVVTLEPFSQGNRLSTGSFYGDFAGVSQK